MDAEQLQSIVEGIRAQRHLSNENDEVNVNVKCGSAEKRKYEARKRIEEIELQQKIDNYEGVDYLLTEPTYSTEKNRAAARKGKMATLSQQPKF